MVNKPCPFFSMNYIDFLSIPIIKYRNFEFVFPKDCFCSHVLMEFKVCSLKNKLSFLYKPLGVSQNTRLNKMCMSREQNVKISNILLKVC